MTREHCPLCGTQMVEKPSTKWAGKYDCPECDYWEYDHSAIKEEYLGSPKYVPKERNLKSEYADKQKV